jgi:formate hydrogenlyase regulatory protein HycA
MLKALGIEDIELRDVYVRPFRVEIDGILYELVYERHVSEDGREWEEMMLWPNDIMFHPPWDSGEYST